jgi:uncharacterized protein
VGIPLFYGYGFALYRYLGPFYSVFVGAAIFAIQLVFAHLWLKRFAYGPLEWLWRSCTFLTFATPMRKPARSTTMEALRVSASAQPHKIIA